MGRIVLASSNAGKLREFIALGEAATEFPHVELTLLPQFSSLPGFDEDAPTFAENAAGKALHYSRFVEEPVLADDSGLVVPALGGAPGVHSARYAGPHASDAQRIEKLLAEMRGRSGNDRAAQFVCVLALAQRGQVYAVLSDFAGGTLLEAPRGADGFGYDPVFLVPELGRTFAELSREEKNRLSHRGRAFRRMLPELLKVSRSGR